MCGCRCRVCPHVCRMLRKPISAPRRAGSAATSSSVAARQSPEERPGLRDLDQPRGGFLARLKLVFVRLQTSQNSVCALCDNSQTPAACAYVSDFEIPGFLFKSL